MPLFIAFWYIFTVVLWKYYYWFWCIIISLSRGFVFLRDLNLGCLGPGLVCLLFNRGVEPVVFLIGLMYDSASLFLLLSGWYMVSLSYKNSLSAELMFNWSWTSFCIIFLPLKEAVLGIYTYGFSIFTICCFWGDTLLLVPAVLGLM